MPCAPHMLKFKTAALVLNEQYAKSREAQETAVLSVDMDYWNDARAAGPSAKRFIWEVFNYCGHHNIIPRIFRDHHHMLKEVNAHPASRLVVVDEHDDLEVLLDAGERRRRRHRIDCANWASHVSWGRQATFELRYQGEYPSFCDDDWVSRTKNKMGWGTLIRKRGLTGVLDYRFTYIGVCLSPGYLTPEIVYPALAYMLDYINDRWGTKNMFSSLATLGEARRLLIAGAMRKD